MARTPRTPAAPKAPRTSAPKSDASSFTVLDKNGHEVRTYSVEVHGDNAAELAQEFVTKNEARGYKLAE